jgi:hypothetical protein
MQAETLDYIKAFWPIAILVSGGLWLAWKRLMVKVPGNTTRIEALEKSDFISQKDCNEHQEQVCEAIKSSNERISELGDLITDQERKRNAAKERYDNEFKDIQRALGRIEGAIGKIND